VRSASLVAVVALGGLLACTPAEPSPTAASARPTEAPSSAAPAAAAGPAASSPAPGAKPAAVGGEITVFAASSLTDAFKELGDRFQATNPASKVTFNFGASTQLRTQLEQGARADAFASANQAEMDKAKAAGVIGGPDTTFARNRLVVILPKNNPGQIKALEDLAKPGLKLVTAAPEVPIGVYTQDLLDRAIQDPAFGPDFKERVNANIVSRETNVRQVVAKVSLGEADAAVVYTTDVTPDLSATITSLAIPDTLNNLASYPIAVVKSPPSPAGAETFVSYVLGPDGQAVLKKWGFIADLAN
jgi:molybdate transport system substrate-binding protein